MKKKGKSCQDSSNNKRKEESGSKVTQTQHTRAVGMMNTAENKHKKRKKASEM